MIPILLFVCFIKMYIDFTVGLFELNTIASGKPAVRDCKKSSYVDINQVINHFVNTKVDLP